MACTMHPPDCLAAAPLPDRRHWLGLLLGASLGTGLPTPLLAGAGAQPPARMTRRALSFPGDHGAHPDTGIEWWYVTGALQASGREFGFQLTFFRARVASTQTMRSAFAARQLIFAHVALTDLAGQRLLHDQRIARSSGAAGVDLASASTHDTDVRLRDWQLQRIGPHYQARALCDGFGLDLRLQPTQPVLLQGEQGWSRKGPALQQASFYYSQPQLQVSGQLQLGAQRLPVSGRAWLDHEWSDALLAPQAVGWDWVGINLHDGGALTAFQLRDASGQALWAGGSWRAPGLAQPQVLAPTDLQWQPQRHWRSPASATRYPVEWLLQLNLPQADTLHGQPLRVRALLDAQELDSQRSTGAIYWEGLSDLLDAQGQALGRGYLEMTGYSAPLRLG